MENIFGISSIPSIVIICYLLAQGVKVTEVNNKYIPIICGVSGGFLGVLAMYTVEAFPAHDILSAISIGIVSGLSATGVNQIFKQLKSEGTDSK